MSETGTDETERRVVTDGCLEETSLVTPEEAGEFLVSLGEELRRGDEVRLKGDNWEIPFRFGGAVELEVEYDGKDGELEVEVEMQRSPEDDAPEVS